MVFFHSNTNKTEICNTFAYARYGQSNTFWEKNLTIKWLVFLSAEHRRHSLRYIFQMGWNIPKLIKNSAGEAKIFVPLSSLLLVSPVFWCIIHASSLRPSMVASVRPVEEPFSDSISLHDFCLFWLFSLFWTFRTILPKKWSFVPYLPLDIYRGFLLVAFLRQPCIFWMGMIYLYSLFLLPCIISVSLNVLSALNFPHIPL